jgi:hypothetical protein
MSSWNSYPSIFSMGHRAIKDLLTVDVNVEEKVDGSQFSFGLVPASEVDVVYFDHPDLGKFALKIRSKGCVMHIDAPEKMFNLAAETVRSLGPKLVLGWTYRGEFLGRPKHNALAYDRTPNGHIILFDINTGDQEYLSYEDKKREADRLGLECVPLLYSGRITTVEEFRRYLTTTSILGGQTIEGVVVKPSAYNLFGQDKKALMGKFVSEAFKEVHRKTWGESNPTGKDIIGLVTDVYRSPARWNKAIQHMREAGKLVDDYQDIGPIIREIPEDVLKECKDDIMDALFKWAWPHIRRGLSRGFPEYYKDLLLKRSFENETGDGSSVAVLGPDVMGNEGETR